MQQTRRGNMKPNPHHSEILSAIIRRSGKPTQHTFLDSYLGNTHPRYPIDVPTLRLIAKEWMKDHRDMPAKDFHLMLTGLINAPSATEKCMAGVLLDASTKTQRKFDPHTFDTWLDQLEGWAEVDTVCTGPFTVTEIPNDWQRWKKILVNLSKSKNINKRRASLVLLCSPLSKPGNEHLLPVAFANIDRVKHETPVLITKAISWLLRSAVRYYGADVKKYLAVNKDTLPKIAVRETSVKLKTGKKSA
jgi:3-methyladenine DNA glycosylase AlkD